MHGILSGSPLHLSSHIACISVLSLQGGEDTAPKMPAITSTNTASISALVAISLAIIPFSSKCRVRYEAHVVKMPCMKIGISMFPVLKSPLKIFFYYIRLYDLLPGETNTGAYIVRA